MHTILLLVIMVVAVPYMVIEHIKWNKRVDAAKAKRLRMEAERHARMQERMAKVV